MKIIVKSLIPIQWSLFIRTYYKHAGYRLPLVDQDGNILIVVLRGHQPDTPPDSWEVSLYPRGKSQGNSYWFESKKHAQEAVCGSLSGRGDLIHDNLSRYKIVEPPEKRGKATVRTIWH